MCFTISSVFRSPRAGPIGTCRRARPGRWGQRRDPFRGQGPELPARLQAGPEACGTGGRGAHYECHCGPLWACRSRAQRGLRPQPRGRLHRGREARPRSSCTHRSKWAEVGPGENARARVTQKPLATAVGPRKAWWRMPARGCQPARRDRDRWPDFTHRTQAPLYGQRALSPPGLADFMHSKY